MLAVWRKTHVPHLSRQRKTMQTRKATCSASSLVAFLKQKPSHKEKKQKNPTQTKTNLI
jgi:hypothetical protein